MFMIMAYHSIGILVSKGRDGEKMGDTIEYT